MSALISVPVCLFLQLFTNRFGYVEFSCRPEAERAVRLVDGHRYGNMILKVKLAKEDGSSTSYENDFPAMTNVR